MVFGTSFRVAADGTQPLNRRLTNLSNAIEKFGPMGFHGTFEQLYRATGASRGRWTAEQIDVAAELLGHAHDSWHAYFQNAGSDAHRRKSQPGYLPLRRGELFEAWWSSYFVGDRRAAWCIEEPEQ